LPITKLVTEDKGEPVANPLPEDLPQLHQSLDMQEETDMSITIDRKTTPESFGTASVTTPERPFTKISTVFAAKSSDEDEDDEDEDDEDEDDEDDLDDEPWEEVEDDDEEDDDDWDDEDDDWEEEEDDDDWDDDDDDWDDEEEDEEEEAGDE
jgi:hypothetical protein